jgi:catechol 2,3-dioxygenase-like lactoylglutathione lyase family enzyme
MPPHDHPHDHDHDHDHEHGHHHHHHEKALAFRLRSVRLYCGDLGNAITFYRDLLGLPLVNETPNAATFDTGDAQLTVEHVPHGHPAHQELVGRFAGISLMVPDLAKVYGRMTAQGVAFLAPPQPQAWGGAIAHFRDSAGNIVSLVGKL